MKRCLLGAVIGVLAGCAGAASDEPGDQPADGGSVDGGSGLNGIPTGERCQSGTRCADGGWCTIGRAQYCVECLDASHCSGGNRCILNICRGGPCDSTADCTHGLRCIRGTCGECATDFECGPVADCQDGFCQTPEGCGLGPDGLECHQCEADTCKSAYSLIRCVDGRLLDATPCLGDSLCHAGACRSPDCIPGLPFCVGNSIHRCTESGVAGELIESCEDLGCNSGECRAIICEPGELTCSGNGVAKCNASGTGVELGIEACVNQVCRNGACEPLEPAE